MIEVESMKARLSKFFLVSAAMALALLTGGANAKENGIVRANVELMAAPPDEAEEE